MALLARVSHWRIWACLLSGLFYREIPQLKTEDIDALRGGIGGEIAFLIQNLASCTSGFVISLVKNWKLTLVMLMAAPFMGAVEAFVAKVINLRTTGHYDLSVIVQH